VISEASDKVEIKKHLLKKLIELKIMNEQLNQEINQKLAKKKVIEEMHSNAMHQEIVFSKLFIKYLVQWEVKYNERSQETPIVFELFPVETIKRGNNQTSGYNLFKVKYSVTLNGKFTDISMIKDLEDFIPTQLVPTFTSADGHNLHSVDPSKLFISCFTFVCDKIKAVVNQIGDTYVSKIHMKTLINICSNQLYGFKRLLEDLRDIYSSKIPQVYISSITTKSNILEKRDYYDNDEPLLLCKVALIDTQKWFVEVLLNIEW
jgi:hypothetical protein